MKKTLEPRGRRTVQFIALALAMSVAAPAFAQDNPNRKERRESREEKREERAERREERAEARREALADTPREARQEHREDRREARQEHRQERREVKQERRIVRREVKQERREDRREVRQERREDRREAQRYAQQYQQRLMEQQRRWVAYNAQVRYNAPYSHRYRLDGRYWNTSRYGADLIREAANHGYAEGIRAGRADRYDNWRFDYRDARAYRDGAYGYNGRYVSRDHYAHYFREGFRRGYEDGYYGRSQYGRHQNGQYFMIGAILSAILGLESI